MVTRTIHTEQYDVDLGRLLARRLEQCGADCVLEQTGNAATICVPDEAALPALSERSRCCSAGICNTSSLRV